MGPAEVRELVFRVLSGQHTSYYIYPDATAFLVEGLEPEEVQTALWSMEQEGIVVREQIPTIEKTGEQVLSEMKRVSRLKHLAKGTRPEPVMGEPIPGGYMIVDEHRLDMDEVLKQEELEAQKELEEE